MLESPDPRWASPWNFGPPSGTELSVGALVDAFVRTWGSGSWEDRSAPDQPHEAGILRLCIDKAVSQLGWRPRWSCAEMTARTANWYRRVLCEGADARRMCEDDIQAYGDDWE